MSEPSPSSIIPVVIGALGALFGVAIGNHGMLQAQSLQTDREATLACIASIDRREGLLREKAESYLAALSDGISFFRENNEFELREARENLADIQKSALAISVYAGSDLSLKSMSIITTLENALLPENIQQLQASLDKLTQANAAWHPAFRSELDTLEQNRHECRISL